MINVTSYFMPNKICNVNKILSLLICIFFGNILSAQNEEPGLPDSPPTVSIDGLLYNLFEDSHTAMIANANTWEGDLAIPEQITYENQKYIVNKIEWLAFAFCTTLTKVRIPKTVTDIQHYASYEPCKNPFVGCTSLETIKADDYTETQTNVFSAHEAGQTTIEINETNFPDENFRKYLLTHYYYCADSVLTEAEIAKLEYIYISEMGIKSLRGIEYLTALINLECTDNQLTELDVSNNTALTYLDCSRNQLATLNVSGCAALGTIKCQENLLTTLDVSGCTKLEDLSCIHNQITTIDLSKNATLSNLSCSDNQLSNLDVTKCIALKGLYCDGNLLAELDLSKNKELTGLACYNNQLTTLDVSQSPQLFWLAYHQNRIKGVGMDALLEGLPTVVNHTMNAIYNEGEENVMTKAQVTAAKAKGWIPYAFNGNSWQEYAGSEDPQPIDGITAPTQQQRTISFDLSGRPVPSKSQRGLYIQGGRIKARK